ncbi:glycosyltransferase family 2 protein [Bradyrhizobium sp. MOS002]|uniref:glycosyltransferase family 2 protein n=1 Tax=Bradyrhizobium sp. MOS002 TaxID=2133947 RepID=UPI000D121BC8|nr:glycosyltransferase family 2 protein [Bradyrhizobium sp. MOS002]PSO25964.1 glycosyltransferase family 2 protein [Bradyrhizobium sp. MOS002]
MISLAVIVLTHNEDKHIARSLQSVRPIASEVFVIDSGSQDRTVDIARREGATVLTHPFVNYAKQFQWALNNAAIQADWVMRLDADEIVEPDLAGALAAKLPLLPPEVTGINLKRKHIFMGRWIRHGGRYPLVLLRVWRRGAAEIEDRWMDEHMVLKSGRAVVIDGGFADCNLNDLTFFTTKHNRYATREAMDVLIEKYGLRVGDVRMTTKSVSAQAAIKRWTKEKIYNRCPFWLSVTGYFLYRYVIRLGFLDGREGLVYHLLQGFWYRFLVGAKVMEYEKLLSSATNREEAVRELAGLTGYDVSDLK